jgi:hypothetical protein
MYILGFFVIANKHFCCQNKTEKECYITLLNRTLNEVYTVVNDRPFLRNLSFMCGSGLTWDKTKLGFLLLVFVTS